MTRKLTLFVLLTVAATTAFAETTTRYMVVMKRSLQSAKPRIATNAEDRAERGVREMPNLDMFAADLTAAEVAELRRSGDVLTVEPVQLRSIFTDGDAHLAPMAIPYATQVRPWGLDAIHAPEMWQYTRGEGVNVAVVDTGIATKHPDLAANYAGGFSAFKDGTPEDDHGHGSHVAGTIAAVDNGFGVVGIAPKAKLWAVKVLDIEGNGSDETLAAGIDWVIAKKKELGGPWVANMSLGSLEPTTAERTAMERAAEAGVVLIAASGNSAFEFAAFPANYPTVMAVGATDRKSELAWFSNYGAKISVVGPGVDVPSSFLPGKIQWAEVEMGTESVTAFGFEGSPFGTVRSRFVDCGYGRPEDFPSDVAGKIAVVQRGPAGNRLLFREKARNAKLRGAAAVIIYNDDDASGPPLDTWTLLVDPPIDFVFPLTVSMSNADAKRLLGNPDSILSVTHTLSDYRGMSGTSMSCPHVSGAAALLLSLDPTARRTEIERALERGAFDIGQKGYDYRTGWGLVDVIGAAKELVPELFGITPPPVRRRSARH